MPVFGNKFTPKKSPVRKVASGFNETQRALEDLGKDGITLSLGEHKTVFNKGSWAFESGLVGSLQKENQQLQKQLSQLEEEKNMLMLKFEVLLDMCTQSTAESHLKDREIEVLKKELESS